MITQAFEPASYSFNPHALPPLVVGTLIACFGILVLRRERGSGVSIAFLFVTTSVALWLLTLVPVYSTPHEAIALWWIKVMHLGITFIPSVVYIFALTIVQRLHEQRILAWSVVALSGFFYLSVLSTDWFVAEMIPYFWGFYPRHGPVSIAFVAVLFWSMVVILRLFWVEHQRSSPGPRKQRLRGLLLAFGVGYLGSWDLLPTYGIPVYPFGYLAIFSFIVLATRAIWRYRLMDLTPAFAASQILETMQGAVIVVDLERKIRLINRATAALLGYKEEELTGQPMEAISPALAEAGLDPASPHAEWTVRNREMVWHTRDDRPVEVSVSASTVTDAEDSVAGIVYVAVDLMELRQAQVMLRKAEEQLQQSERLEAMVKLAGAVAGDFSKLLAVITRQSDFLLDSLPQDDRRRGRIEEIKRAGDHAAALNRQLLAFGSAQPLNPKVVDLNAFVNNLRGAVQWLIGKEIELVTALDPALGFVKVDPSQIELVLATLTAHARDAMPGGGRLSIATANAQVSGAAPSLPPGIQPGKYVTMAVSDTGPPMDAETQTHLFEPFFINKRRSIEKGLGMATVYGIVKQSGGHISVASEQGRGTTFKIYLPRIE